MRRFGWQIGGVSAALALVVALGMLAFGCGSGSAGRERVSATARPTPRASATVDPRVAQVQAAAKAYVEALNDAMKTGSPAKLDSLSVPGSQAEGNAGVSAHVLHDTGRAFVVTRLTITSDAVTMAGSSAAIADIEYTVTGFDAAYPSLRQLGDPRTVTAQKHLEFTLVSGKWLVDVER